MRTKTTLRKRGVSLSGKGGRVQYSPCSEARSAERRGQLAISGWHIVIVIWSLWEGGVGNNSLSERSERSPPVGGWQLAVSLGIVVVRRLSC